MKKAMFVVLAGLVAGSQFGCLLGVNLLGIDTSKLNSLSDIVNIVTGFLGQ